MDKAGVITSRQNALVRHARAVREGKVKELIFVEGLRLCEEAVRAGLRFEAVLHTNAARTEARSAALLASLEEAAGLFALVSEGVLETVSDTKTPQGIVALALRPRGDGSALSPRSDRTPLVVILHGLNNPANAGAMLRSAEAAGATGAIATAGTTDLFSPKALRGAMGAAFRLPLWQGASFAEALRWCAGNGIRTTGTDARAAALHTNVDWTMARAVVVGREASGLTAGELGEIDESVRIPMREPVESLNAAVALGIVLYEAARQRGWPR